MITEQQKREYITLAQQIYEGKHTPIRVLQAFELHPNEAAVIINFWMTYNDFTQSIVDYLAIEKLRIKFENNYKKELPKWHQKTISYGLTCLKSKLKKIWN